MIHFLYCNENGLDWLLNADDINMNFGIVHFDFLWKPTLKTYSFLTFSIIFTKFYSDNLQTMPAKRHTFHVDRQNLFCFIYYSRFWGCISWGKNMEIYMAVLSHILCTCRWWLDPSNHHLWLTKILKCGTQIENSRSL